MALSSFVVSKRQSGKLANLSMDADPPQTGRLRVLSNSILELETESEVVSEVTKLWGEAQEKFLAIGRYLVRAKSQFSGSFEREIISALPFGKQIAYQLRMVAEAVDAGRLRENTLPRSYSTAFQLSTLAPPDLEVAEQRGLIRSTVTRHEVDAFKRELKTIRAGSGNRKGFLLEQKRSLGIERQRLEARLREIQERFESIESELLQL